MSETSCPIRRFALDSSDWTPVIAPCACDFYAILGTDQGSEIWRCSDPENVETQHKLGAGGWYALLAPFRNWSASLPARFQQGDIVAYLKADQGTETAIVEFIL